MVKLKNRILSLFTAAVIAIAGLGLIPGLSVKAGAADDKPIIVSLGDSYSSGEGIEPFYGQDKPTKEKVKDQDWLAHRSEKAWGGMLTLDGVDGTMKDNRGTNWFFAAASGAEIKHINSKFKKSYNYDGKTGSRKLDPQIKIFDSIPAGTVDYVTLTLGGNDVGFGDIMYAAVMKPKTVTEAVKKGIEKFESSVRAKLKKAYKAIEKAAGKQATIIVAGYPHIMNDKGFTIENVPLFGSITVSADTAKLINEWTDVLNDRIKALVGECKGEGMNICFVSVTSAFAGHEAYTENEYINGVILKSRAQDLVSGSMISGYSLHPNAKGAKAYASVVQKKINALEKEKSGKAENKTGITVKASSKDGKVTLKWDAVEGASKYRVYEYADGKATLLKTVRKTATSISGLSTGTDHKYIVTAYVDKKWSAIDEKSAVTVKVK